MRFSDSSSAQRLLVGRDSLLRGDVFEVLDGVLDADAVEVVDLAAREDRREDLVFLGGGEDEDRMGGGLFEGFQEGVEGRRREHVDLVDDEHGVASHLGDDAHLLDERADVLHGVVRRGVEFVDVERTPLVERAARFALVARFGAVGRETVDGLGEDPRAGGFPDAAGPAEEIGVSQLSALDGILERGGDMFLPDDRTEGRGAVFACADDEITHGVAKIEILFLFWSRGTKFCGFGSSSGTLFRSGARDWRTGFPDRGRDAGCGRSRGPGSSQTFKTLRTL